MEVQKIDKTFYIQTPTGRVDIKKKDFKDTSKIIEEFVLPQDIEAGIRDFHVLKSEFVSIVAETKFHKNGCIQFYQGENEEAFRIHSIL
jgi:hypothetical protein